MTDREERLLKEYEICQEDSRSQSSSYWTIFGIFLSINTAILGGLLYGIFNSDFISKILHQEDLVRVLTTLTVLTMIVMGIISSTILLKRWLDRVNYLIQNNNGRIHEIEIELDTWRSLKIHIIDKWNRIRKKHKHGSHICQLQNKNIWRQMWKELSLELPKETFGSLCKQRGRVKALTEYKTGGYAFPSRNVANLMFWFIYSDWILIVVFFWALLLYPGLGVWTYLLYLGAVIVLLLLYRILVAGSSQY